MIPRTLLNHTRSTPVVWLGCTLVLLTACVQHWNLPPMGDPLPSSAKLDVASSIKQLTLRYTDSCGRFQDVPIGGQLEDAVREGMRRTFKTVIDEGDAAGERGPDHVVHVELVDSSLNLNKDALYDRVPAGIRLSAIARVTNRAGEIIRETAITTNRQERLRLEQLSSNCNYMIDPFIHDAVVDFATRVTYDVRLAAGGQVPSDAVTSTPPPSAVMPSSSLPLASQTPGVSALRFKALLLDENNNLIFEGGEHLRVRVDVVNTGTTLVENASISLTGTPAVIEQFPATTLRIPPLQPGQTKSVEFIATLPMAKEARRGEIHVTVQNPGGSSAPEQTLSLTITPTAAP